MVGRRWLLAGAISTVAVLSVLLVLLAATAPVPSRHSSLEPLVHVQTWSLPQPAVATELPRGLPTAPPPDWEPMPPPPPLAAPAPPLSGLLAPPAATPAQAVANAFAEGIASGRFWRVAVALYDRHTHTFYGAGDITTGYRAASVVKVLIAARLLRAGRADGNPLSTADWNDMWKMVTCSDNAATDRLWWRAGGWQGVIPWVKSTYGIALLSQSERPNAWGTTWITATGMAEFYARAADDPAVSGWLLGAMANANPNCGGQFWGLPVAAASWAVKQGWVCCWSNPAEPQTRLHSTGYVDGYRYVAVLLTEGPQALYWGAGRSYVTAMAQALLPGGYVPRDDGVVVPARNRAPASGPATDGTPSQRPAPSAPPPSSPPGRPAPSGPVVPGSGTGTAGPLVQQRTHSATATPKI